VRRALQPLKKEDAMTYEPNTEPASAGRREQPAHPLIPADRVNGTDVYGSDGEKIGKVEDVAIDKVSGRVAYAILAFGGFMGIGERYHPVPWSMLRYDVEKRGYVIPCLAAELESAPSFEADELSGWNDTDSRIDIYRFYTPFGATPYWT
jgi:sporulation protein YlmC with PRC-barrel domain